MYFHFPARCIYRVKQNLSYYCSNPLSAPMFDFRLKVFHTVARRLSFTRAAEELFITQPAVTKHIHEIEAYYKTQLFQRNGTRIKLTPAGKTLFAHTEELFAVYRKMEADVAAVNDQPGGTIRIGASTTVAQYVLPRYLALFRQKFPAVNLQMTANNTEHIEQALLEEKIDVGIVEGQSKRKQFSYSIFLKDEIVCCTRSGNPQAKSGTLSLKKLPDLPWLFREQGSGSLEVIATALKKVGLSLSQLKTEMVLESTESIKNYLLYSDAFAFVSIHSILRELENRTLTIVDIHQFSIERHFYFVRQQGDKQPVTELLLRFLSAHNLK